MPWRRTETEKNGYKKCKEPSLEVSVSIADNANKRMSLRSTPLHLQGKIPLWFAKPSRCHHLHFICYFYARREREGAKNTSWFLRTPPRPARILPGFPKADPSVFRFILPICFWEKYSSTDYEYRLGSIRKEINQWAQIKVFEFLLGQSLTD